jgi:hypothetical protein
VIISHAGSLPFSPLTIQIVTFLIYEAALTRRVKGSSIPRQPSCSVSTGLYMTSFPCFFQVLWGPPYSRSQRAGLANLIDLSFRAASIPVPCRNPNLICYSQLFRRLAPAPFGRSFILHLCVQELCSFHASLPLMLSTAALTGTDFHSKSDSWLCLCAPPKLSISTYSLPLSRILALSQTPSSRLHPNITTKISDFDVFPSPAKPKVYQPGS